MKQYKLSLISTVALLSLILLGSCHYYKTLELSQHSKEAIQVTNVYKNYVLVHDKSGVISYQLRSIRVTDSTLSGILSPTATAHPPHAQSLKKQKVEKANRNVDPLLAMHIYLSEENLKEGDFETNLSNIESIEIHEKAVGKSTVSTIAVSVGIPAGISLLVGGVIIATSDCACPFVESQNGDTAIFHGSVFPGSIFKSLQRDDYLELENVALAAGSILNLKVYNNMPETEYIDQLKLYEVSSGKYQNIVHSEGNFFTGYNNNHVPIAAINGEGFNVTTTLLNRDEELYNFENTNQTSELNSLEVIFSKANLSTNPKISFVAKQSRWLENVANFLFENIGNRYNDWVAKKDETSPKKWIENSRNHGIALNVFLKNKGIWQEVGHVDFAGSLGFRQILMDLDLSQHTDSIVELKLESAYKIWEIDQIALTDDFDEFIEAKEVEIVTAINQNGEDVKPLIAEKDAQYLTQDDLGTYTNISSATLSSANCKVFLKANGYYHHKTKGQHDPNYAFLKGFKDELAVHELSKTLELSILLYSVGIEETETLPK